jgi:hypothetical protein
MASDFEILWEKAQREPETKVVSAKKTEFALSVTDVMDRYLQVAGEAVVQKQMPRETYDELVKHTTSYKASFSKLGPEHMLDIGKRIGKRLIDRIL